MDNGQLAQLNEYNKEQGGNTAFRAYGVSYLLHILTDWHHKQISYLGAGGISNSDKGSTWANFGS